LLGYFYHKLNQFEVHRYDVVTNLARKNNYDTILDIGCYEGHLLEQISKKCHCKNIFGIDINKEGIEICKDTFPEFKDNFSLQSIDNETAFSNDSFDLITMVAVLEHVFDPLFSIEEVRRILKPGGTFIVEVPNIAFIKYRLNLLFGKRPRTSWDYGWDGGHLQLFTKKDLEKLLRQKGFTIMKSSGSGIFLNMRGWWPSLLLPNIIIQATKN
jgi:2-polyprenyl-3-methyl-5-hydroxy-6-metoxy-1,4-benzoquinol methylase